jgi:hypothetical protein
MLKLLKDWRETQMNNRSFVRRPNHPNSDALGRIRKHRLQAAEALGKSLPVNAVVHHHPDGTLIICENQSYHRLLHVRLQAYEATGDPNKRKCRYCGSFDFLQNLVEKAQTDGSLAYAHRNCLSEYNHKYWLRNKERLSKEAKEFRHFYNLLRV